MSEKSTCDKDDQQFENPATDSTSCQNSVLHGHWQTGSAHLYFKRDCSILSTGDSFTLVGRYTALDTDASTFTTTTTSCVGTCEAGIEFKCTYTLTPGATVTDDSLDVHCTKESDTNKRFDFVSYKFISIPTDDVSPAEAELGVPENTESPVVAPTSENSETLE